LLYGYVPDSLPSGLFPVRRGPDLDERESEEALSAARERVERAQVLVMDRGRQSERFKVGDLVQIASGKKAGSRKWRPRWVGPFQVRESNGHGSVLVEYEPGKAKWFSARWLSRYVGSEEDLVEIEPVDDSDGAWVRGWMAEDEGPEVVEGEEDQGAIGDERGEAWEPATGWGVPGEDDSGFGIRLPNGRRLTLPPATDPMSFLQRNRREESESEGRRNWGYRTLGNH